MINYQRRNFCWWLGVDCIFSEDTFHRDPNEVNLDNAEDFDFCLNCISVILFLGTMSKGKKDGHGYLYWKDGSYYAGEWKEDKKDGEGTMFYSNGDVFAGHWKEERKEGQGEYIYSSGTFKNLCKN